MLKRGKNRPSNAVLLAEVESLQRTFGRRPAYRPRCPFPGCAQSPAPLFCSAHWLPLAGTTRRELLTELRQMQHRKQAEPTQLLRELFGRAIDELKAAA